MNYRCKCGRFVGSKRPGNCLRCAEEQFAKKRNTAQRAAELRDTYPSIKEWCEVSNLTTEWRCPNGCPDADGLDDTETCDHGSVFNSEALIFDCWHCGYTKRYKVSVKLIGGKEWVQ